MDIKHLATRFSQLIIFLGCLSFVLHRGYKCLDKYVQKQKSTTIEKVFSQNQPFPSITFCPYSSPEFKEDILKKCNLTKSKYYYDNIWKGNGDEEFCNDPKELNLRATWQLDDLKLTYLYIEYKNERIDILQNVTWKRITLNWDVCFSLILPQRFHSEIIKSMKFYFYDKPPPDFKFYVHQENAILNDLPIENSAIGLKAYERLSLTYDHDVVHAVDLGGVACNDSVEYSYDDCIYNQIHEVSIVFLV